MKQSIPWLIGFFFFLSLIAIPYLVEYKEWFPYIKNHPFLFKFCWVMSYLLTSFLCSMIIFGALLSKKEKDTM